MKKLISIVLLLALALCIFASCSPKKGDEGDDTTVPEVTSPDGFDDVTAPPEDEATTFPEKEEDTTVEDTTAAPSVSVNDAEEAVEYARNWLGETDPDTGYKYAFSYDGSMIENDKPYFRIRVSWYIEEQERYSLCGYLLVGADGEVVRYSW
ncbi:MAG: hypothetical protein E7647_05155 [Ruminococcaceae bacterium]|nr:hypothetical protein [Oscillospiraceae bacterium]